jgi:hypothetical protein
MNLHSSTINQWSVLSGLIPVIYSLSRGEPSAIVFDAHQESEILLTILQSALGFLLLVNLKLEAYEAGILFLFWLIQFLFPSTRDAMVWVYAGWCGLELVRMAVGSRKPLAVEAAWRVIRSRGGVPPGVE